MELGLGHFLKLPNICTFAMGDVSGLPFSFKGVNSVLTSLVNLVYVYIDVYMMCLFSVSARDRI